MKLQVFGAAIVAILGLCPDLFAQNPTPIELGAPHMERGSSLMQALSARESIRAWSDRELSLRDLSDLLWAANQAGIEKAPLMIVLVSDLAKLRMNNRSAALMWGAADSGIVSENINLFCAANGLATVTTMNVEMLRGVLKLKDSQQPLLNNPVGYRK